MTKNLIPSDPRGGWAIALIFSVIYLVLLLSKNPKAASGSSTCHYCSDGFCVTNFSPEDGSCPQPNSHRWAWQEDAIFTVLAVVLGNMTRASSPAIMGNVAVILVHGLLHLYFDYNKCDITEGPTGLSANVVAYAVFIALLSYVAINRAYPNHTALSVIGSIAVTAVTVLLSQPDWGYGVSPIFMTTQLLVSFLGVSSTNGLGNTKMGYLFTLPCIVSIIELVFCCDGNGDPGFFNKIGGHAWYDFVLHIAVLSSYFPDPDDDKTKTEEKVE